MATLATGLPATALTGLDFHQLDSDKRFHQLILVPPFLRFPSATDASLLGQPLAPAGAARPAAAQRVDARHGACADSASRLGAARRPAPAPRSPGRNKYCRDRKRCRCSPAPRSPDTYTAGRSSPAPHATRQKTVDKFVQCAHNRQADRPHPGTAPKARAQTAKIFTRAFLFIRVAQ